MLQKSISGRLVRRPARLLLAAASGMAVAVAPLSLKAQSAPHVTGGHLPSREEITRPAPPARPRAGGRFDSAGALDTIACTQPPGVQATIDTVAFSTPSGAPLAPPIQKLLAGFAPDVTGNQPIRDACTLRDKATGILRRAGFVAAVQIVPSGAVGTLQLQVVTAHIIDVQVQGNAGAYRKQIKARIAQLEKLDPLNEFDAEKILLLANETPGLEVKMSLRSANRQPGEVIGDLSVTTHRSSAVANVNNEGSRQIGPGIAYVRGEVYGLTGNADVTYLGLSPSLDGREQRIVQVGHSEALGNDGGRLGVSYTYALSRADYGDFILDTKSSIGNVEYSRPLARSLSHAVNLAVGLDIVEQKTQLDVAGMKWPYQWDKLRVGYARLSAVTRKPSDVPGSDGFAASGALELRQGLDILGATKPNYVSTSGYVPSRLDGDGQATEVRADADALWGLGPILSLAGTFRGQWANRALLSYEEYAVGNLTIGRGYDPGIASGDRAIGLRGEVRAHIPATGDVKSELFSFYDDVRIWNLYPGAPQPDQTLASWGVGGRIYLPNHLIGEVMYAKPLDRVLVQDPSPPPGRLLVSVTLPFQPGG